MMATGYDVWNNLIEKVLCVTETWHQRHPSTHLRLRLALLEACQWLAEPENRLRAASILAEPQYLDLSVRELEPSLKGEIQFVRDGKEQSVPYFHVFGKFQAGFPWRTIANDLLREIGRAHV